MNTGLLTAVVRSSDGRFTFLVPPGKSLVLGRRPEDADIAFPMMMTLSRRHARFRNHAKICTIEDVGSRCGIYVNAVSVRMGSPVALQSGDIIALGGIKFIVHLTPSGAP